MPTITITCTDPDDPQSPQTYTLPQDVAAKLVLVAAAYRRPPAAQAGVILEDALGLFKPPKPADKIAATDQHAAANDPTKGRGRNRDTAKDANGAPASTTIGTGPLTGTGLS